MLCFGLLINLKPEYNRSKANLSNHSDNKLMKHSRSSVQAWLRCILVRLLLLLKILGTLFLKKGDQAGGGPGIFSFAFIFSPKSSALSQLVTAPLLLGTLDTGWCESKSSSVGEKSQPFTPKGNLLRQLGLMASVGTSEPGSILSDIVQDSSSAYDCLESGQKCQIVKRILVVEAWGCTPKKDRKAR